VSVPLQDRVRAAIMSDLEALTTRLADDEVVGLGAYTDADASNIVVAVHTRAAYDRAVARRPEYPNYLTWSIGEWDLMSFEQLPEDALVPINQELAQRLPTAEDGAQVTFREAVWEAVVGALEALARSGQLDRWPHAARAFEPVDAGVSEERIRGWTARLNTPERLAEYDAARPTPRPDRGVPVPAA